MKKIMYSVLLITISIASLANPNAVINLDAHYDKQHNLVNPDQVLVAKAIKAYQQGYNGDAISKFKQAAAFGNSDAQMYVGLMYLKALGVSQNWAKGYAWIKLAALDQTKKHVQLKDSVYKQLKPEERLQSQNEYQIIEKDYNSLETLKRRDRWVHRQKLKATGTRTGSQTVNVQSQSINGVKLDGDRTSKMSKMEAFVNNYGYGIVELGEIIPKQD
jgi:TPR repeat protein